MSAKSKHGRGKHRKKAKFRQARAVSNVPPQEIVQDVVKPAPVAAPAPVAQVPVAKAPASKKSTASAALPLHYEFIGGDLKRIGILAGVILVLLIGAYYIFS